MQSKIDFMEVEQTTNWCAIDEMMKYAFMPISLAVKDKLYDFLREYYVDSTDLKYVMSRSVDVINFTRSLETLAVAVVGSECASKEARGAALYLLADGYSKVADFVATLAGLNLDLEKYLDLFCPSLTDDQKRCLGFLRHWEAGNGPLYRRKAEQYAQQLDRYSAAHLYGLYVDQQNNRMFVQTTRIGKQARSLTVSMKEAAVGERLVWATVRSLDGEAVTVESHQGKVVVLYIWSSRCEPCRRSIPDYRVVYDELQSMGRPFEVVTLSVDRDEKELRQFIAENSLPFVNCMIGYGSRLLHQWRIVSFPTSILIDEYGVIRAKGYFSRQFLTYIQKRFREHGCLRPVVP